MTSSVGFVLIGYVFLYLHVSGRRHRPAYRCIFPSKKWGADVTRLLYLWLKSSGRDWERPVMHPTKLQP